MGSERYNVGDVVCLKSGGVNMVVAEVDGIFAMCQWHDANGSYNTAKFRVQTLTHNSAEGVVGPGPAPDRIAAE